MVLAETLAVDDEIWLNGHDGLKIRLTMVAEVDDRCISLVRDRLRHERDGCCLELNAPVGESLERAVVGGNDGLRRHSNRVLTVVVLNLDRGGCSFGSFGGRGGGFRGGRFFRTGIGVTTASRQSKSSSCKDGDEGTAHVASPM